MEETRGNRGGWLVRALLVLVVWVGLAAGAYFLVVTLARGGGVESEGGVEPADAPATVAGEAGGGGARASWTDTEAAADPAGFLSWAIARADAEAARRERALAEVAREGEAVRARGGELRQNLSDVENVHARLKQAYQRAEDEGRWPMRVAGRSFEKAKAEAAIAQTAEYLANRQPLREAYDAATADLDRRAGALRSELEALRRLRERLGVDREVARLDAGKVDPGRLAAARAELEALSAGESAASGGDRLRELERRDAGGKGVDELLE